MSSAKNYNLSHILDGVEADIFGVVRLDQVGAPNILARARALLPKAVAVVIMAQELMPEVIRHLTSKRLIGEMAMRDIYEPHMTMVNGRLTWQGYRLLKQIHKAGYAGLPLMGGPVDGRILKGALYYPELARAAGLGYRGWHSMLITPEFGTRQRLGGVLTTAPLAATKREIEKRFCDECGGACVKNCPSGAITMPGKGELYRHDRYVCSTYIQAVCGCSECVRVCPTGPRY